MRVSRFRHAGWLTSCLALLTISCPAQAGDDQKVTGSADGSGVITGIVVGIKTSDFMSSRNICTTSAAGGCTVTDMQSSIPKNIGNMLCLPNTVLTYSVDSACKQLLGTTTISGCLRNSMPDRCGLNDSYTAIALDCDWQTDSNASVTASWYWTLQSTSSGMVVQCSQTGYVGAAR